MTAQKILEKLDQHRAYTQYYDLPEALRIAVKALDEIADSLKYGMKDSALKRDIAGKQEAASHALAEISKVLGVE